MEREENCYQVFFGADHTLSYAPELQRPGVLHCLSMSDHSANFPQAVGLEKTRQNKGAADAVINYTHQLYWHPKINIALMC